MLWRARVSDRQGCMTGVAHAIKWRLHICRGRVHEESQLPADRFFDPRLVRGVGRLSSQIFEAKTWVALRADSQAFAGDDFLEAFPDLAWVIAAYIAIIPYRAWPDVVMWLDHTLKPATAATMDRQAAP